MTGYEIAQLPRSASGKRMLSRVSPIYDNSVFMKFFYEAIGSEFDVVRGYFETLRDQSFSSLVEWGIEYQERKYSIVPDKTLTLEQRRARLRLKTSAKRPLSPAILEQYARDNFGLEIYLDETKPGYIRIQGDEDARTAAFIKWLAQEKPAHLLIDLKESKDEEIEIYFATVTQERGKIDIPSLDISNEPDLFIGVISAERGKIEIQSEGVPDLFIGNLAQECGEIEISPQVTAIPEGDTITLTFKFPTGTRTLTLNNLSENATVEDLNVLSQFIEQNNLLILNEETSTGISSADIVSKDKV